MRRSQALSMARMAAVMGLGISAFVSSSASPVAAQTFPPDDAWRLLYCGTVASFDPFADESGAVNERDVVGDATGPALFLYSDASFLYFRMRVESDPGAATGFNPHSWGFEFDTDGDRTSYEVLAQLDGNRDLVTIDENTMQATLNDPGDMTEST